MSALGPLEVERRCLLFLSSVFGLVGFFVGLNALVKLDQERSYIRRLVVPHGIIDIGIHDVFATAAVITAICALLALLSGIFCAFTWYPIKYKVSSFRIQSWALFFCAAWLFVTLVTYDYFFAKRSARITVNLRGQRIPEPVIQHLPGLLDFTYVYRDVYFLRLLAVLPWCSFILAMVASVVLCFAAGRTNADIEQDEKRDRVGPSIQAPPY